MQRLLLVALAALLHVLSVAAADEGVISDAKLKTRIGLAEAKADPRAAFEAWARLHSRTYLEDAQESEQRFRNWMETLEHVETHSRRQSSMQLGLGPFSDLTDEEFRERYLGQRSSNPLLRAARDVGIEGFRYRNDAPPAEVDWRKAGIVGPIKNQHVGGSPCGCCWTFATTGIAECINAMYTGEVVPLSEQQLIDCDHAKPYEDAGCEGGDFTGGLHYIITHGGINTEDSYPYLAHDSKCDRKAEQGRVVTLDAWETVPPGNETALMQAVARHPVAVGMCVGPNPNIKSWHAYEGGIFDGPSCETPIDHAMLVVGYGSQDGQDYWLVKNSWGTDFGEEGFIKFKRNTGGFGYCSVAHEPAFAIKTSPNPSPNSTQPARLAQLRSVAASGSSTAQA